MGGADGAQPGVQGRVEAEAVSVSSEPASAQGLLEALLREREDPPNKTTRTRPPKKTNSTPRQPANPTQKPTKNPQPPPKQAKKQNDNSIPNPKYKGLWEAPDIDNPEYKPDDSLYVQKDLKYVAFELWQVKSGSIFDNVMVTDDFEAAMAFADETWGAAREAEREAFDAAKKKEDEEKKAAGGGDEGGLGGGDLGAGLGGGGAPDDEDEYDTESDAGDGKTGKKEDEKKEGGEVEKDEL